MLLSFCLIFVFVVHHRSMFFRFAERRITHGDVIISVVLLWFTVHESCVIFTTLGFISSAITNITGFRPPSSIILLYCFFKFVYFIFYFTDVQFCGLRIWIFRFRIKIVSGGVVIIIFRKVFGNFVDDIFNFLFNCIIRRFAPLCSSSCSLLSLLLLPFPHQLQHQCHSENHQNHFHQH